MAVGGFLPFEKTAWMLVIIQGSFELYVNTAQDFLLDSLLVAEAPIPPDGVAGLPLARLRRSLVRRRYSLRQVAKGVNRVKYRISDLTMSHESSARRVRRFFVDFPPRLSCPGKYLANAILHAWGVVTSV